MAEELNCAHILCGPPSKSDKVLKTIGQVFFELCRIHPDKIFQIEADTEQMETYAQAKMRAVKLACALKKKNMVSPGDTAMVCSENTIDNVIPVLASLFLGAKVASIDPTESVKEMAQAISYTQPKIIFTEEKSLELVQTAYTELRKSNDKLIPVMTFLVIDGSNENKLTIKHFSSPISISESTNFELYSHQDPLDTAIYVFTSGTTSLPKPVALSHYGVLNGFKCLVDEMDNVKPDIMIHFASLYWISAILLTGVILSHGSTKVIAPKIPAMNLLELIEKYQITFAFMSNTYTYDITNLSRGTAAKYNTSSLYSIIIGGSTMDPKQLKRLRETLPNTKITVGYGSSECAAVSAFDLSDVKGYQEKILASGKIVADVEVKLVDVESRQLLGPNSTGEILVRSPYMMKGYHTNCKTVFFDSTFDEEGFLKTGDLGYYDLDEYLYVTDRLNDTFKYKTYQVSPLTIERVLLSHPAVKEAVAFNIPHEQDRNHSAAVITLKQKDKNGTPPSVEEIIKFANEKLSEKNKIRAPVWILDKIPFKTRTGKVQRSRFREHFSNLSKKPT